MKQFEVPSLIGDGYNLEIRFPEAESDLAQDAEWFEARLDGEWRRFRIHDYDALYKVPGLYECVIYRALKCNSPVRVTELPRAYARAIDGLETPAWIAFNIKEDFVQDRDESGFAAMLRELAREDVLRTHAYRRYRHRFSSGGKPLYYGAMVVTKQKKIPGRFL